MTTGLRLCVGPPVDRSASDAALLARGLTSIETVSVAGSGPSSAADALLVLGERLAAARGPVVLLTEAAPESVVLQALPQLVGDDSGLVVSADGTAAGAAVRTAGGRVIDAGSSVHQVTDPDSRSQGLVLVSDADREPASLAATSAASQCRDGGFDADPLDLLVVALVRAGVDLRAVRLETASAAPVAADRPIRPEDIPVPTHDGFYSTFVLRRLSRRLSLIGIRRGWSPNAVTAASLVIALLAAAAFCFGTEAGLVVGALLLQVAIVVDCVDGEVARATGQLSTRGAWFDGWTDRVKEYAAFAGLAIGSVRSGDDVWLLAAAALTLQVFAHLGAFGWDLQVAAQPVAAADRRPFRETGPRAVPGGAVAALSDRTSRRPTVKWVKRTLHFPIGERWLLISVLAVLGGARWVFVGLLVVGSCAAVYSFAGRVLRSPHLVRTGAGRPVFAALLDAGPLSAPFGVPDRRPALAGPWRWLAGPVLRAAEYGVIIWLVAVVSGPDPVRPVLAFTTLFALCLLHYDVVYRTRILTQAPPRWARLLGLGVEGRVLVVVVLALLGAAALEGGLLVLTLWLAVLDAAVVTDWVRRTRPVVVP